MQKFISTAIYEIRNEMTGGKKPYSGGNRRQQPSARGGRGGKRPSTSRERKPYKDHVKVANNDGKATTQKLEYPLVPLPNAQNVAALAKIEDIQEKKQFIGNMIYPCILSVYGNEMVGKITGMLLDEKVVNLEMLVTNQVYLSQIAG